MTSEGRFGGPSDTPIEAELNRRARGWRDAEHERARLFRHLEQLLRWPDVQLIPGLTTHQFAKDGLCRPLTDAEYDRIDGHA